MKIDIHTHILPRSWPELEGVNLRNRECPDGSVDMVWVEGHIDGGVCRVSAEGYIDGGVRRVSAEGAPRRLSAQRFD